MTTNLSPESRRLLDAHAVTIYRHRDPSMKDSLNWWVCVNEDAPAGERFGGVRMTLEDAVRDAFRERHALWRPPETPANKGGKRGPKNSSK